MFYQIGSGKCSMCGSEGVTKTTCPNNPAAKNKNPITHYECAEPIQATSKEKKIPVSFKEEKDIPDLVIPDGFDIDTLLAPVPANKRADMVNGVLNVIKSLIKSSNIEFSPDEIDDIITYTFGLLISVIEKLPKKFNIELSDAQSALKSVVKNPSIFKKANQVGNAQFQEEGKKLEKTLGLFNKNNKLVKKPNLIVNIIDQPFDQYMISTYYKRFGGPTLLAAPFLYYLSGALSSVIIQQYFPDIEKDFDYSQL
jgi:hypothetical protein